MIRGLISGVLGSGSGSSSATVSVISLIPNSTAAAGANTSTIQTALNAGGSIGISGAPGDIFYINATLLHGSNTFVGGNGIIIKAAPGTNGPVLANADQVNGNSYFTFEGIIFDGDHPNQTVPFSTVTEVNSTHFLFKRCEANGALRTQPYPAGMFGEGFRFDYCSLGYVEDCYARNNTYDGFKTRTCTDMFFTNIFSVDCGKGGLQISFVHPEKTAYTGPSKRITANGVNVSHSTGAPYPVVSPTTYAVFLRGGQDCVINNVVCYGTRQGISMLEGAVGNIFTNAWLACRYAPTDGRASLQTESGDCNHNTFNNITLRPLSGNAGNLVSLTGSACTIDNLMCRPLGAITGVWTVLTAGSSNTIRNFTTDYSLVALTETGSENDFGEPQCLTLQVGDETTPLTVGTSKCTVNLPFPFHIKQVKASVATAATGTALLTVDVNEAGTSIFSTRLTFDSGELTTGTAATPPVITSAGRNISSNTVLTVDIDQVGNTTPGAGLKVYLIGNALTFNSY